MGDKADKIDRWRREEAQETGKKLPFICIKMVSIYYVTIETNFFPGIISNIGAETLGYGPVAPFVVALAPLVLCGVLVIRSWEENYGNRTGSYSFAIT